MHIKFSYFFIVLSLLLPAQFVSAAIKAPTLTLSTATSITSSAAALNGKVTATGGENPTVTVYWGTTDGGKTTNWANASIPTSPTQPQGVTAFLKSITGLTPGTKYYFTAKATNSAGTSWPAASLSFTTAVALPTVAISPATSIATTTATLNGNVTSTGGKNPTITFYWGTTDGGTTPASWTSNSASASQPLGLAPFLKNITGLTPGTKYYFTAKATNSAGTSWPVASLSFTTAVALPTLTLSTATSITSSAAALNGKVTATGGENPTVTVYWGTTDGGKTTNWANASIPTSPTQPQGVTAFLKSITGLTPGTKYYFTAKATNSAGTSWPAASLSFTTAVALPTVINLDASNISTTTATTSGIVGDIGGKNPTVTVYWGKVDGGTNPSNWTSSSAPTSPVQPQGAAIFFKNLTGLTPGTKYYFTAKATNSAGTSWPVASLSFTTAVALPTIALHSATNILSTSATLNGNITITGGENPTVTVYWGTTDGGVNPANWASSSVPTTPIQPQGIAAFLSNVTGLSPGTKYYFTAKATNSAGTSWPVASLSFTTAVALPAITINAASSITTNVATLNGNVTSTGGKNPTVTFYWGKTDGGTTTSSWTSSSAPTSPAQPQGIAAFLKSLTGLTPGTKYYFTAKATNSAGTSWPAASLSFTTAVVLPVQTVNASSLMISAATNVTTTSSTLNGNITSTGGENPTVTVYWGTTDGGNVPSNWTNSSVPTSPSQPQGIATFVYNIANLTPSTTYYFTAKATNSAGTSWPVASLSFTTGNVPPALPTINIPTLNINTAAGVSSVSATLNGRVTSTGGENPTVTVYWGTIDGGVNPANWANSSVPTSPSQPQGATAFSYNVTGLSPLTTYYFTAKSTNSAGTSWPATSLNFTTGNTTYTLTLTPSNGTTIGSAFSSIYDAGSVLTFTAIPTAGFVFDHWSGDATGSVNPLTIIMDSDKSIIANFLPASPTSMIRLSNVATAFLSKMSDFLKNFFIFKF